MKQNRKIESRTAAFTGRSSFGELLDAWLEREQERCKTSTYVAYVQRANCHLSEFLGQHRTILVRRLRSQNFRQIVQKFKGILCVLPRIFGRYDGILCKQDVCRELCGVALVDFLEIIA